MGGRALKSTPTKRCSREEFDLISNEILLVLNTTFNKVGIPLFFNNKESFGDIDIIVSMDGFNGNMNEYITNNFHPNEIFHNGNCWSFDYKEIQVDFITTSAEHFDSLIRYMDHNDKGNLIGRLAHHKGIKFGEYGLWYEHYFKDENICKIIISKDQRKIYEFLGLNYDRNLQGFDELEDIFKFIADSKYFDWRLYQLKNLNKVNRERNLKRKSYMSFLDWIDENRRDDKDVNEELYKDFSFNELIEAFPESNLEMEIRKAEYEHCKKLYIKSKFNGGEVMRIYGLKGKELGDAMVGYKNYINSFIDYDTWIIENDKSIIHGSFVDFINGIYLKK